MSTFKRITPWIKNYRRTYIVGAFFVLISAIFLVVSPWFVKMALENLETEADLSFIFWCALGMVFTAALRGVFMFLTRRWLIYASRHIERDMRNQLFSHLLTLSPNFYHKHPTGDLMAVATNDLSAIREIFGPGIMYSISTFISGVFIIINMILISPLLCLIALCVIPIMAFTVYRFGSAIHRRFEMIQEQFGTVTTRAQENLSGVRVIRSYVREDHEIQLFKKENREYVNRNRGYVAIQSAFRPAISAVMGMGMVLIMYVGGKMVIDDIISFGEFTAFSIYMSLLIWPAVAIGWVSNLFQRGAASLKRLQKILDSKPQIFDSTGSESLKSGDPGITIRNLSFRYEKEGKEVLKELNFTIEPGKTTAIIGPTGSGKTTLVNLLARLYPIERGMIFINGQDINEIRLKDLRELFGFSPQEAFLFSDKLNSNIAFAHPEAEEEVVRSAADMAMISGDILEFPDKFHTMLGEKGVNLSGGQRQRTALARAILKDPKILIMDDSLAAVDTRTEKEILNNLESFTKGRTVIIIAHRISTIAHADKILVLSKGRIVEEGVHETLIKNKGPYADLNEQQRLKHEIEVL